MQAQSPMADGKGKFLGNVYSNAQLQDFETYWNQVTPENAGKWGSVERTRDSYDFAALDAAYKFAKDNGFVFRYHVLVWGNQQPSWIEDLPEDEQLAEITEWMDTLAARYPGIDYLEVVNEPINDPPNGAGNGNYLKALGGTGTTGFDWMVTAFTMAKERFPNAKLMMNEYNIVNSASRSNIYIKIAKILMDKGLLDVVGVQAHAFSTTADADGMKAILDNISSETGLPMMVTEMDIDGPTDDEQLQQYQRIFPVFWEHPSIIGVTLWGFRPGLWRNEQKAYLIDTDGSERPAMKWLIDYIDNYNPNTPLAVSSQKLVVYPNPVKDGVLGFSSPNMVLTVKIFDLKGATILEKSNIKSKEFRLDFNADPGTYLVKVSTQLDSTTYKIIVE